MSDKEYPLDVVHSVYYSDMPGCQEPYKISFKCGVCGEKAGSTFSNVEKPPFTYLIKCLRDGALGFDITKDDLGLRCYEHLGDL
jgi:hypothetical protein